MEVISGLCFGQSSAPEDKLVEMLLNIVFTEREEGGAMRPGTRELTPYKEDLKKTDKSPVIRSFLLQLLLEHKCVMVEGGGEGGVVRSERTSPTRGIKRGRAACYTFVSSSSHSTVNVKGHLNNYFEMSRQALTSEVVDLDLCLLCTQCFEVCCHRPKLQNLTFHFLYISLSLLPLILFSLQSSCPPFLPLPPSSLLFQDALDKELSSQPLPQRLAGSVDLLQEGMESLMRAAGFSQRDITLDLLEGVAKVRYALQVAAGLLQQQINEVGGASPASHAHIVHGAMANRLLEEARHACTMEGVNTIDSTGERNTTGPIVYLLKMIVRQWGVGCLKKVLERHQWVVPVELRQDEVREGGKNKHMGRGRV